MRARWALLILGSGLIVLAGCRSPGSRGSGKRLPAPDIATPQGMALAPESAAMAKALAYFGLGILREGLADGSALASYQHALEDKPDYDALYVRAAIIYIKQGQTAKAIALMEDACRNNPRSVEACLYLAQIYQALNQPQDAIRTAGRAIRIEPAGYKGYVQLAYFYLTARDEPRALATLEEARRKAADKRPVLRFMGDLYAQKIVDKQAVPSVDAAKAIACYEAAAALPPDDNTLLYQERLGDLYLLNRQPDKALKLFQDLAARLPNNIQLQKKLALCYMASGRKEDAVEVLKSVAGREPRNSQVQFYLGELYETLGNTNKAIASFRSAVDTIPSTSAPYLKLALYYLKTEPQKAGQTLQSGLQRFPEDKQLLEMAVQHYLRNQQPRDALNSFIRLQNLLMRDNERQADARYFLDFGLIAQQNNMYAKAVALYEKALEQDPDLLEAYIRMAFLHLSRQALDEALNVIDEAVIAHPENPLAWYYFGMLYNRAEAYTVAIGAFERGAQLAARSPRSAQILDSLFYFNYGAACERAGQFKRAEGLLMQSIRLDTENAEAFNYLAYMWAEKGINLNLALEYIQNALDCDPDNGAFIDTLGWILYKQKKFKEALVCLQSAYYFIPDDPTIMEHLGDAWIAAGDKPQGLAWLKRSYRINPSNKTLEIKLRRHGADIAPPAP